MILQILALVDFLGAFGIIFSSILPYKFMLYVALFMMLKGGIFLMMGNIVSILDLAAGFYMILLAFNLSVTLITIVLVVYLLQKVFFSLVR